MTIRNLKKYWPMNRTDPVPTGEQVAFEITLETMSPMEVQAR